VLLLAALVAACTSDATRGDQDAGAPFDAERPDHVTTVGPPDSGGSEVGAPRPGRYDPFPSLFDGELTPVRHGEYLARHIAGCVDCHSPKRPDGSVDEALLLSGVEDVFDLAPDDDGVGAIHSRNLTPHPSTGLGGWSDVQVARAITMGTSRGDAPIHPTMPYWAFALMSDDDVADVVAYLRSVPPIDRGIPARQTLPTILARPARALELYELPATSIAADDESRAVADRGRTLAAVACLNCHTELDPAEDPPVRLDALFVGRRKLVPFSFGLCHGPSPFIESKNLTPHESGISGYTAQDVRIAMKTGLTRDGIPLCPPMPVGPEGAFGEIRDDDAIAIGTYLTSIAPRDSGEIDDCCVACHTPEGTLDVGNPL
jgi:mono/diheme cytochrome c family protein